MNRLAQIMSHRRVDVERLKAGRSLPEMERAARDAPPPLDFVRALRRREPGGPPGPALIAEIKRASPSRGDLAPALDPLDLACCYRENGAAAISVLTETRHFKGSLDDLRRVAAAGLGAPLLRKDFIFDPWQVYEARQAGADAVLLIAACLEPAQLTLLHDLIVELGMAALVEVHNRPELETALACRPALLGINNRNLLTFDVSLETTFLLRPSVPPGVTVVSESGIHSREDVLALHAAGVDAILVGEALVTSADTAAGVRSLIGTAL
jgi:indole-3-glycerol phosphate synthase